MPVRATKKVINGWSRCIPAGGRETSVVWRKKASAGKGVEESGSDALEGRQGCRVQFRRKLVSQGQSSSRGLTT